MRDEYCVVRAGRCTGDCAVCPYRYDEPQKDNINLPDHYARFKFEPVHFIGENKLDWFQGNIIKYVCRYDAKNGIEDLNKAKRYLEMYIKYLNNDPDWWKK
jgi:hypothetical protein